MGSLIDMETIIENYISEVLQNITADTVTKNRIRTDLYSSIKDASAAIDINTVLKDMGTPKEVAKEFMENIYENDTEKINRIINEKVNEAYEGDIYFEYKSKTTLFGLPLVHVKFRTGPIYRLNRTLPRTTRKPAVAKGIFAFGEIAKGIVSLGFISIGIFSFGAISAGLFSFAAFALGVLSFGGISVGALAFGGVAIGFGAIGGCAIGLIAEGGFAYGHVAIGGRAIGDYVIQGKTSTNGYSLNSLSYKEAYNLIKSAYPNLSDWIIKIFTFAANKN
jgi:hypothetical protein